MVSIIGIYLRIMKTRPTARVVVSGQSLRAELEFFSLLVIGLVICGMIGLIFGIEWKFILDGLVFIIDGVVSVPLWILRRILGLGLIEY